MWAVTRTQTGRITVDGHDLRDVTFLSLRSQLGIVPQEPFLFAGTIRDNIKFAKPDATEEVRGIYHPVAILPGINAANTPRFMDGIERDPKICGNFLRRPRDWAPSSPIEALSAEISPPNEQLLVLRSRARFQKAIGGVHSHACGSPAARG
jgi:hypothetical protein